MRFLNWVFRRGDGAVDGFPGLGPGEPSLSGACKDRIPGVGSALGHNEDLGERRGLMVEGPVGSKEESVFAQLIDQFINLPDALAMNVEEYVWVPNCKRNGVCHISCAGMPQDEVDLGMLTHSRFIVSDQCEPMRVFRLDARSTTMKEDRETETPTLFVDPACLRIIRVEALNSRMKLDSTGSEGCLPLQF